ncbi:hypothetical protein [Actinokineospora enzanensis]|uniref:hypothetical protein n=1 Tax=Actinokineospora enzanensis TaxID=155975 RepID=UPI0003A4BBE8|nr:hypothetical protein [Actinokineospora enzanensis]
MYWGFAMLSADVVVSAPALDRPVLTDKVTASLLRAFPNAARAATVHLGLAVFWACLVVVDLVFAPAPTVWAVAWCCLFGLYRLLSAVTLWRMHATMAAMPALLATTPWRPVRLRLLKSRSLEVSDGDQVFVVRAMGLLSLYRGVLRRTGTGWIAGPDQRTGVAAVRVEGSYLPFPARRSTRRPDPLPERRFETRDPTTRLAVKQRRSLLALVVVALTPMLGYVIATDLFPRLPRQMFLVGVAGVLLYGLLQVRKCVRLLALWRLPSMLRTGRWVKVEAAVTSSGTPRPRARVRYPDGTTAVLDMWYPGVDLVATMAETKNAWVIGTPRAGGRIAVGFPGYPMVTLARVVGPDWPDPA